MLPDVMVRATAADGHIRLLAARTSRLVESARRRHDLYPVAAAALGRSMTGALLLAQTLKENEHVTFRLLGDGPLGAVVADADGKGGVRGYVKQPHVLLPLKPNGKLDVGRAVGDHGIIAISRDLGREGPYSSSAPLVSGEVAEDLASYLATSEQVPSAVALGVLVGRTQRVVQAGGVLAQLMPGGHGYAQDLEVGMQRLGQVTERLSEGLGPEDLLRLVAGTLPVVVHEECPLRFRCHCSRHRIELVLQLLSTEDLQDMLQRDQGAEVRCQFCGKLYHLDTERLTHVLDLKARKR